MPIIRQAPRKDIESMETFTVVLESLEDLQHFGEALGRNAVAGDIICLDGDLGAGKTTLTQSIARGLEVPDECYVTSPSFALFHEYPGRLPLYHMDFYRLRDYTEIEDLGLDEYFYLSGCSVIEWSLRAEELLPESSLHLRLAITGESRRTVTCDFISADWQARLRTILRESGLVLPNSPEKQSPRLKASVLPLSYNLYLSSRKTHGCICCPPADFRCPRNGFLPMSCCFEPG